MNEFDYDVRQKKALVPSARRKVNGSRSKGCTLPSDNLTEGARKKLNGEIVTINMNKPYTYEELSKASEDVQRQYIKRLQDEYNASVRLLGPMPGISYQTVRNYLDRLGLTRPVHTGRPKSGQREAFEKFCNQDKPETAEKVEQPVTVAEPKVEQTEWIADDDFELDGLSVEISGTAYSVCKKLISMLGAGAYGVFEVRYRKVLSREGGEN